MSQVHVYSEIGRLRRVMLNRPEDELRQIHPFLLDRMLFQDTPYLERAQKEHDAFADAIRSTGAEVVYIRDLFAQAMAVPEARVAFTREFVAASGIASPSLAEVVADHYASLPTQDFVDAVFCGIRCDDPMFEGLSSLGALLRGDDPFVVDPLPNSYFARDSSINVGDAVIFSHMCKPIRQREPILLRYVHRYSDLYRDDPTEALYRTEMPWSIEGGDVMVVSHDALCIGCFGRTQPGAIETLAPKAFDHGFKAIYAFHTQDPHVMHLDGMLTMIDVDTFMCNAFLRDTVEVIKLTPGAPDGQGEPTVVASRVEGGWPEALAEAAGVPKVRLVPCGDGDLITGRWESSNLGNNLLAVAPGEVVAYDRNVTTLDLLDKAGITVHTFDGSELSRGKGGPRCMSMPIWREEV